MVPSPVRRAAEEARASRPALATHALRPALALGLVLAVGLGACGDAGDERAHSAAVPAERWREELDRRCVALNEDHAPMATAAPSDAGEAVEHAEEVHEVARALAGAVDAPVADPDELEGGRSALEDLRDAADRLVAAAAGLVDATRAGDADEARSAVEEVRDAGDRVNEVTGDLDLPACGGY